MGNKQKTNTKNTYVTYRATSNYDNKVDSVASERDYIVKQHMVSAFDRMTMRKSDGN